MTDTELSAAIARVENWYARGMLSRDDADRRIVAQRTLFDLLALAATDPTGERLHQLLVEEQQKAAARDAERGYSLK